MNMISALRLLPEIAMNGSSSVFLAENVALSAIPEGSFIYKIFSVAVQIFYFACKWLMYFVDIIYFYILELAGISADTSVFDMTSSDMTFRVLLKNKTTVSTVVKNMLAIAIILILVTAIMAIIKQQKEAFQQKKANKGAVGEVVKSMSKAFMLLILTPLIAIIGIIASSVLLRTLFNATNTSDATSLSARLFNASASGANRYNSYASQGVRIPIKFYFKGDKRKDAIQYTCDMLSTSNYPSMSYFNEALGTSGMTFYDPVYTDQIIEKGSYSSGQEAWLNDTYYTYYDHSDKYKTTGIDQYRVLKTHQLEYYAMSDVICYAMDTMEPLYIITIQELLDSLSVYGEAEAATKFNTMASASALNIELHGASTTWSNFRNGNYQYLTYKTTYADTEHTYYHIRNEVDEIEGASFIVAYRTDAKDSWESSIDGEYYNDGAGSYKEAVKYYIKDTNPSRYKHVDLYYIYDAVKDKYVKSKTYNATGTTYYYKLGDEYYEFTATDKDNLYYKKENGEYQKISAGTTFYTKTTEFAYAPLLVNTAVGNNPTFVSQYVKKGLITARGVFDAQGQPTAIRKLANGKILFYRDNLELVSDGDVSKVGNVDEIEVDEDAAEDETVWEKIASGAKAIFTSIKNFFAKIFNPLRMIPFLNYDDNAVETQYTNRTDEIMTLTDGKLHISYFFGDSLTPTISKSAHEINLTNLYDPMSINYVILIFGSVTFFRICIQAVFALISRILKLVTLIMIYPVACATIPWDESMGMKEKGGYGRWSEYYKNTLLSTFGLILALNIVFIIIPIIESIEFISAENLQSNLAATRIGMALTSPWTLLPGINKLIPSNPNYLLISKVLNEIIHIMFIIVAFAVIAPANKNSGDRTFMQSIQEIVGVGPGSDVLEGNVYDKAKGVAKKAVGVVTLMVNPTQAVKNKVKEIKKDAKIIVDNLPGSEIAKQAVGKLAEMKKISKQDSAKNDLVSALKDGKSKEEVQPLLDAFNQEYGTKLSLPKDKGAGDSSESSEGSEGGGNNAEQQESPQPSQNSRDESGS